MTLDFRTYTLVTSRLDCVCNLIGRGPQLWRYFQTLRVCWDEGRAWPALGNALKYATAHAVTLYGLLHPVAHHNPVWIGAYVVATLYQLAWDVMMDWCFLGYDLAPHPVCAPEAPRALPALSGAGGGVGVPPNGSGLGGRKRSRMISVEDAAASGPGGAEDICGGCSADPAAGCSSGSGSSAAGAGGAAGGMSSLLRDDTPPASPTLSFSPLAPRTPVFPCLRRPLLLLFGGIVGSGGGGGGGGYCHRPDACCCGWLSRSPGAYYAALGVNATLRFSWILSLLAERAPRSGQVI